MSANHDTSLQGKYCLNCGTGLKGSYCHYCGQKKLGDEHGFFHTMFHFIGDFFHFDSQIFKTIIPLVFKPGFLAREYIIGRRADYLNPIRLYVFLSLIFFSVLFLASKKSEGPVVKVNTSDGVMMDSISGLPPSQALDVVISESGEAEGDTFFIRLGDHGFNTVKAYTEWQDAQSPGERHGKWTRLLLVRMLEVNERTGNVKNFTELLQDNFLHNLPKMAFLFLPFVALWLKLLYVRSGIPYMHHLIVIIQSYNLTFLLSAIAICLSFIPGLEGMISYLMLILALHFFLTLKSFYQQSWKKTILKSILFGWGLAIMFAMGTVINILYSIFSI